jgi:hypothetical protein
MQFMPLRVEFFLSNPESPLYVLNRLAVESIARGNPEVIPHAIQLLLDRLYVVVGCRDFNIPHAIPDSGVLIYQMPGLLDRVFVAHADMLVGKKALD